MEEKRKQKILLLSDDLRFHSGVGTISKEIVLGTAQYFDWVQIGAGINHPDAGKVLDLSDAVNSEMGITDAKVKVYPYNGYGDMNILREVIRLEKPDALMIFTDPRYWLWLFQGEREVRSKMPIIYLNIWDNLPYPMWNKPYYESCDGLFAISKQTYNINKVVLGEKADTKTILYVPHGVSSKYFPISDLTKLSEEDRKFVEDVREGNEFVLLYNARNLGRKRTSDLLLAWRGFCDTIGKENAKKCKLILHTDPVDNAGTDLIACYEAFCDPEYVHVAFNGEKYSTERMNLLYNACDGVILTSSAEGWGLSLTEALMTGKMFIAPVTGGMQDQMRFEDEDGNWISFNKTFPSNHTGVYKKHGRWCIPVKISVRGLVGSPMTPYIFDDKSSVEDFVKAIEKLYRLSPEDRRRRGLQGHKWACSEEAGFTAKQMSERIREGIVTVLEKFKQYPRSRAELIKVDVNDSNYVDYNPIEYSK